MGQERNWRSDSSAELTVSPEVRRAIAARARELHERILAFLGRLLLVLGIPYYGLVILSQEHSGRWHPWLVVQGLGLVVLTIASLLSRASLRSRRHAVVASAVVIAICSLRVFGPLIGVGLMFVAAALLSTVLQGKRMALWVTAVLSLSLVWEVLEAHRLVPILSHSHFDIPPGTWQQAATTTIVVLIAITVIFSFIVDHLWKSLALETSTRIKERRLEQNRQQVMNTVAAAQRLESLGRLAGGVAHDFNNALVVIQCGVAELRKLNSQAETVEVLNELDRGIDRATTTARQLLSFARRDVEETGVCNPQDVVTALLREAARILPAHIRIDSQLDATLDVNISTSSLEQALLNLVLNARDAMPRGGTISVRLQDDLERAQVELSVTDTGIGMSEEVLTRAFDPFFTTKGELGTGLGLAMVRGAMNKIGGSVELVSRPDVGTTIRLILPHADIASRSSIRLQVSEVTRINSNQHILVLEDEPPVQRAIQRILGGAGYEVTCVARVAEARAALARGSFSLLLSDGIVPDGRVEELVEEFRRKTGGRPVIVCSGYDHEELALTGLASGRVAFLAKPFSPEMLLDIVQRQLERYHRKQAQNSD